MSDENTIATATETATPTAQVAVKRGRGRPKGTKNKPKDPNAPVKERKVKEKKDSTPSVTTAAPVTTVAPVFIPDDTDDVVESSVEGSSDE